MSKDFAETYKGYSHAQLLLILEDKDTFQPAAVEAAEHELASRQLTQEQVLMAREEMKTRQSSPPLPEKIKFLETQVKSQSDRAIAWVNPINFRSPEKQIQYLCLMLGAIVALTFLSKLTFFVFMFQSIEMWDLSIVEELAPYVYLPLTIYLLLKKSKIGWRMLTFWVTYKMVMAIYLFSIEAKYFGNDDPMLENIRNIMSPGGHGYLFYTGTLIIYGALLYFICTKAIRNLFIVGPVEAILTILLSAIVCSGLSWI